MAHKAKSNVAKTAKTKAKIMETVWNGPEAEAGAWKQ